MSTACGRPQGGQSDVDRGERGHKPWFSCERHKCM